MAMITTASDSIAHTDFSQSPWPWLMVMKADMKAYPKTLYTMAEDIVRRPSSELSSWNYARILARTGEDVIDTEV